MQILYQPVKKNLAPKSWSKRFNFAQAANFHEWGKPLQLHLAEFSALACRVCIEQEKNLTSWEWPSLTVRTGSAFFP